MARGVAGALASTVYMWHPFFCPSCMGLASQLSNAPLTIFSHHVLSEQSAFEPCGPFATVTPSRDPREAPRCLAPWTPR